MPKRFNFTVKHIAFLMVGVAIVLTITNQPSSRLFMLGAEQDRNKSGEWVTVGPRGSISDAKFESIVTAIVARGDVGCMRIANPTIADTGFVHVKRLKSLDWLYIEDASIANLRVDMPHCEIYVDSYTMSSAAGKTGSQSPDDQSEASKSPIGREF